MPSYDDGRDWMIVPETPSSPHEPAVPNGYPLSDASQQPEPGHTGSEPASIFSPDLDASRGRKPHKQRRTTRSQRTTVLSGGIVSVSRTAGGRDTPARSRTIHAAPRIRSIESALLVPSQSIPSSPPQPAQSSPSQCRTDDNMSTCSVSDPYAMEEALRGVLDARCTTRMAEDRVERARQHQRRLEDELVQERAANRELEDEAFLALAREAADLVSYLLCFFFLRLKIIQIGQVEAL